MRHSRERLAVGSTCTDGCMYVCMYIHLLAMVTSQAKHCNTTETSTQHNTTETITKGMDGHNDTYSHP